MVVVIRRNNILVVFLRSYLCKFLADGVRNEIITQVLMFSMFLSFTNFLIQLASVIDEISFFKFSLSLSLVRRVSFFPYMRKDHPLCLSRSHFPLE
jgi:hypothetical protein